MRRPAWMTRPVLGWSLFDFANQSFTMVVLTTMFQLYFVGMIVPGGESRGRQAWAACGIVTQLILILVGPVIGALADFSGTKKRLLFVTYLGCVGFTLAMAFVQPGQAWLGAALFVAAYLFYGAGENFLSAFLPELCTHREMGRVSAFSWTVAYFGALVALLVAVGLIHVVPGAQEVVAAAASADGADAPLPVTRTSAFGYQIATAWAAVFFLAAGVPMFLWVPERNYSQSLGPGQTLWTVGFHRIAETARQIRRYRQLFRFLAIMTTYFGGMQIVYWFGGTLTKELFGFDDARMAAFLVLSTAVAIPGAALAGRWQDRIGTRNIILVALPFWAVVMSVAALAAGPLAALAWMPWTIAVLVGLGIGALGTASRAMVGLFSPPQKSAEFFGFYGLAHKLSALLGLSWVVAMERLFGGNFALVVASATIFFAAGTLLMLRVDEKAGRMAALRAAKEIDRASRAAAIASGRRTVAIAHEGPTFDDRLPPAAPKAQAAAPPERGRGPRSRADTLFATVPSAPATSTPDSASPANPDGAAPEGIYLDNNATTRPIPEVVDAVEEGLRTLWQNPSSIHRPGQAVRARVEDARERIARLLGCAEREVVFTSGGTEAANLAMIGTLAGASAARSRRRVIATSRAEHSAVREHALALAERGLAEVEWLPHMPSGVIDLEGLDDLLRRRADDLALVSLMWANNETGTIQPIAEIAARCRAAGVRSHTDAVQWVGRMPCDLAAVPVDLLSFSAHKFHGPKGVGGLFVRRGVRLGGQVIGGPQERDRRGGTENVPGILGMAAAADAAVAWLGTDGRSRQESLRDRFERRIVDAIPDAVINGAASPRLWSTSNIGFPRLEAEAILLLLSERRLCASAGAACSSGSLEPSPVLLALGVPPEVAHGSVRCSLSRATTDAEIDAAVPLIVEAVARLRRSFDGP
ncbi:MAG TPA: MFS transporter [Phycisphaerales bacterium]|nr:MFS transporter [Phycisphaerales bacterium]HMP37684.1 MFS transporter [Phycisphaerales bacterium]